MSEFPAAIGLPSRDGANGFILAGVANDDGTVRSGPSADDVDGDGNYDVIVGAWGANGSTGASTVVFGKPGLFAPNLALLSLDGTTGFRLVGVANDDLTGYSASSARAARSDRFAATSPKPRRGPAEPAARSEAASALEMYERASQRSEQKFGSVNRAGAWKRRLHNRSLNRRSLRLTLT